MHNLLSGVAGQIGGARGDIDTVVEKIGELVTAVQGLSTPPAEPPPAAEDERPTLRVKARRGGRWVLVALGALSLVAQVVALSQKPEYGPLVAAAKVLGTALLDLARSLGAVP